MIKIRKKSEIDKPPFEIGDVVVYTGSNIYAPTHEPNGYIVDKIYQCQATEEWLMDMSTAFGPRFWRWLASDFKKK